MSTTVTCPRCGQPATGNFCASCGASLAARACPGCGAAAQPGGRFCTRCGEALTTSQRPAGGGRAAAPRKVAAGGGAAAGGGGGREPHLGWWAAGGLLVVMILVAVWPILRPQSVAGPGVPGGSAGQPAAGPGAVDLSSMTPRQAADRLHDRVMIAAEAGDSATAAGFVPMAISAYEQARPLDADGLFHLSALQRVAGDFEGAVATANEALATYPDHLLNLYAAAEASREMGEAGQALRYFRRILEVWDREMASDNLDYQAHANMMPNVRQAAANFVSVTGE
jgi:hypothetical protein